jgi:hypothetical protein
MTNGHARPPLRGVARQHVNAGHECEANAFDPDRHEKVPVTRGHALVLPNA